MINLFKAYQVSSDAKFVWYIKVNEYQYENGEEMSEYRTITITINKYNIFTKPYK